jgi:peptidoglycan/LPS O-acetylase OafA/YrhL
MIIYVSEFKKVPFLENSILNDLGKISYGIYMYHFMVIPAVLSCIKPYNNCMNEISFNLIIYFSVIILTVIVSKISYSILEKPIIKMKDKYAIIKSGEK